MALSPKQPQWRRIYRQTLTLIYKNFLTFYKAPISTAVRALLLPIALTIIFCELKHVDTTASTFEAPVNGISKTSYPVKDLSDAITATSQHKLVFVRNGISNDSLGPIIDGILQDPAMSKLNYEITNDPDDLFTLCRQDLNGNSDCFAAIIFTSFNDTNAEYIIAYDESVINGFSDGGYRTDDSFLAKRILPLQWAVESNIGNFSTSSRPSEQPWSGSFGVFANQESAQTRVQNGPFWLSLVGLFVAPIFIVILIGVVYQLSVFVATERQTTMAELMSAQMVTITPRILSTLLSFLMLYCPGFVVCSILLTQILFTRTSDILFLFLTLLAGISLTVSSHFLASFFSKAQLAGLYTSVLAFALALVHLADSLASVPAQAEVLALAAIFPPITWATLVSDVATREYNLEAFSLARRNTTLSSQATVFSDQPTQIGAMDGYLYVIFFILQIIVYGIATYFVEQKFWGVKRSYDRIESSSDVALRCIGLSKTYYSKRLWYWPFKVKGSTVLAVDNLDLEVKKGSVTFLLGPNGGGKTTSLKCIAGMTSMDAGSRLELNEAGEIFGICPQHNVFWSDLTVQEHIKIWRKLKTAAFEDMTADDDDVLVECDLLEKSNAPAKTLSGGQMRKLQLAISFVGASKVCCIDEASSGLDPLSRRNIWNIIQRGQARRTILVTTHFLDEADVLADHIVIVHKGRMVCQGPGTSLKARFGDDYIIRGNAEDSADNMIWRTSTSADATKKVLELEAVNEETTYDVTFPTLEQVFLKVTSDSNTAVLEQTGDGIVGEEENRTVTEEKILALVTENARDIDLDVGYSIGLARQIVTLFRKRYTLLLQKSSWIAYGINLIIPIIIAAALVKFLYQMDPLQTCEANVQALHNAAVAEPAQDASASRNTVLAPLGWYYSPLLYATNGIPSAFVGPQSAFSGAVQDSLYAQSLESIFSPQQVYSPGSGSSTTQFNGTNAEDIALSTREFVSDANAMIVAITNSSIGSFEGFGILAPTPETAVLFYDTDPYNANINLQAFSLITNRIRNASSVSGSAVLTSSTIRSMRHITNNVNYLNLPIALLIALAFITASSIAVIYPTFEKINHVRALHYCNGVSPFALWFGYLLFDVQFIIIQALFIWGLLFAGTLTDHWYGSSVILGVFILFGIATYLGTYVLSLFVKKAAFAIAAGIHVLLAILYLLSYIMNQSFGNLHNLHETYSLLQYGLGLSSPGANLLRALFLASNSFEILCGKFGDADTSTKFAYVRYGSVYANLLIQIIFLASFLAVYEYGSADWFRRHVTHRGIPARLHYIVESGVTTGGAAQEKDARAVVNMASTNESTQILQVSRISKFFGKLFAVENISFDVSSSQTLALLGGNGAGKTTVINMIRGELNPDFGDIFLDGTSVLSNVHKARLQMGVCPQDDAVDNLTVRQTLTFYATVKGLKKVGSNVDKVLNALHITVYENLPVKALSGGTKRKLSVAIALLGNPRILLLDEPSTGQDAGAKRILWKALQDISANRAILLTTHSMEEAEALATNIAIMGTRMLATGTLSSLQETYGGAFCIRAIRIPEMSASETEALIKESFNYTVVNYEDSHGQISFNLTHDKKGLGRIMQIMESLKGESVGKEQRNDRYNAAGSSTVVDATRLRHLQDYTVTGPTLEEVFMNVARQSGIGGGV